MGISLAMAGAKVTLTDLPHITPCTAQNLSLNADKHTLDAQASTSYITLQSSCERMTSWATTALPCAQRPSLDDSSLCMFQNSS